MDYKSQIRLFRLKSIRMLLNDRVSRRKFLEIFQHEATNDEFGTEFLNYIHSADENELKQRLMSMLIGIFEQMLALSGSNRDFHVSARPAWEYFAWLDVTFEDLHGTLLDVAPGGSQFAAFCNRNISNCRAYSVDITSKDLLAKAARNEKNAAADYSRHTTGAWNCLPFHTGTFDNVVSILGALHYQDKGLPVVAQHLFVLGELLRVARNGGHVRLLTMNANQHLYRYVEKQGHDCRFDPSLGLRQQTRALLMRYTNNPDVVMQHRESAARITIRKRTGDMSYLKKLVALSVLEHL